MNNLKPHFIFSEFNEATQRKLYRPGVYIVFLDGVCSYVGMSKKLDVRLRRFFNKKTYYGRALTPVVWMATKIEFWVFFAEENLKELEAQMIVEFKPKYNRIIPRLSYKFIK